MSTNRPDKEEIFMRLAKVIEYILQVFREKDLEQRPKIELTSDIYSDLGIDSLEVMDLVAAIEKEFGIDLNVEQAASKRVVSDLVDHVADILSEKV